MPRADGGARTQGASWGTHLSCDVGWLGAWTPLVSLVLLRLRAPPPESRAARCWPPPASAAAPCLPAPRRVIAGVDWGPSGYEIFRRDSGAWLLTRRSLTTVCGGVRAVQEEQAGRAYPIARRRLVVVMAA